MQYQPPPDRIVRERERHELTGLSHSSWYRLQAAGQAPRPIPLGERSVGWRMSDLLRWLDEQTAKRGDAA